MSAPHSTARAISLRRVFRAGAIVAASACAVSLVLFLSARHGVAVLMGVAGTLLFAGLLLLQWLAVRQLRAKRDAELADALAQSTWLTRYLYEQQRLHWGAILRADQRTDALDDD